MSPTALATELLTPADRCDRCPAQAYVRAVMESGFDLLLCAHHFRKNANVLRDSAVRIDDQTHRLQNAPPVSGSKV
jgi:hypothetical protein